MQDAWETGYNIVYGRSHLKLSLGCNRKDTDSDEDQRPPQALGA